MIREGYELDPSQIELPKLGEIGNGRSRGDNITSTQRGTGTEYTLRRLKRDAPELYSEVLRVKFSSWQSNSIPTLCI
jgi:hypothetical protein